MGGHTENSDLHALVLGPYHHIYTRVHHLDQRAIAAGSDWMPLCGDADAY